MRQYCMLRCAVKISRATEMSFKLRMRSSSSSRSELPVASCQQLLLPIGESNKHPESQGQLIQPRDTAIAAVTLLLLQAQKKLTHHVPSQEKQIDCFPFSAPLSRKPRSGRRGQRKQPQSFPSSASAQPPSSPFRLLPLVPPTPLWSDLHLLWAQPRFHHSNTHIRIPSGNKQVPCHRKSKRAK